MTLRDQLMRDEGLRLKPYRDSVGKLTIGVGRNLDDVGISEEEAGLLLNNDIAAARADVFARLPWATFLNEPRFAVLVNMRFNLGLAGLFTFRQALAAMERGDWAEAAKEMRDSHWAEQVGPRAHRLAQQMESGAWI